MNIIQSDEFDFYWKNCIVLEDDVQVENVVKDIIAKVRIEGDAAVRRYTARFDRSVPECFKAPISLVNDAAAELRLSDPALVAAMELAADHIKRFSQKQKEQFSDFEYEMDTGLVTGQKIIPVERAAVYVPAGRFPLFSSVLMGIIPALIAGVEEVILVSPPLEDSLPDRRVLAAAGIALQAVGCSGKLKIFAVGGAQAIAALAIGTESIPRVDLITGPGNKYVAAAKKLLFGEVGIDFIAGPTDVLIIADGSAECKCCADDLVAADMIAQAEHDPDARARALVPNQEMADKIIAAVDNRLAALEGTAARASIDEGGLIIVYQTRDEAIRIANVIAPEHLELHVADAENWIPRLTNFGSLFIGSRSAEVLGDYSAGINHTLPTSESARFTGGLSVRNFLKTVTTLRCTAGEGFAKACNAAEILARAEGLEGHAMSAAARK